MPKVQIYANIKLVMILDALLNTCQAGAFFARRNDELGIQ